MSGVARIGLFAVLLAASFGGAALAGAAVGHSGSETEAGDDPAGRAAGHEQAGHPRSGSAAGERSADASVPPGLQVAEDGYRLVLERTRLDRAARDEPLRFRVLGADRKPVREFELEHEKRMHLIVVRRDLSAFRHLHPRMGPDGTWTTRTGFRGGGTYRVFADFKAGGAKRTLGADVHVAGPLRPRPLAAESSAARTRDGLVVTLKAEGARAGEESSVEFEVRRDGRPIDAELQPYLGAKGHLVALREGDLAYLHTHPESDRLAFMATYPTAGRYRLFAQFKYRGHVQTAAYTVEVPR